MANLIVKADPSDGLRDYGVVVDGIPVNFVANAGTVVVNGVCGDQSVHGVIYSLDGPAGETLSFTIKCGEAVVYAVAAASITNPPYGNGGGDFRI